MLSVISVIVQATSRECREYLQLQNQTYNTSYPLVPLRDAPSNYQSLPYASMQPHSEYQYLTKNQSLSTDSLVPRSENHPLTF